MIFESTSQFSAPRIRTPRKQERGNPHRQIAIIVAQRVHAGSGPSRFLDNTGTDLFHHLCRKQLILGQFHGLIRRVNLSNQTLDFSSSQSLELHDQFRKLKREEMIVSTSINESVRCTM